MRILLQNTRTGLYQTTEGGWSQDAERAMAFPSLRQARDYASARKLSKARVVALGGGGGARPARLSLTAVSGESFRAQCGTRLDSLTPPASFVSVGG